MTPRDRRTRSDGGNRPDQGPPSPRGGLAVLALSLLLRLYPHRFRERFGDEMLQLHVRRSRRRPGFRTAFLSVLDTVLGVPLAWRDEGRQAAQITPSSHGDPGMSNLLHEAILSLRVLWTRQRSFTTLCVLTLALGLGAATAIFSVVHGVLLVPLPYGEPERIVRLFQQPPGQGFGVFSVPNYLDVRERTQSFESIAAYDDYRQEGVDLTGGDRVQRLRSLRVGSGYFETLGVAPIFGRTFTRQEERPLNAAELAAADEANSRAAAAVARGEQAEAERIEVVPKMPRVVVLSHGLWRSHFGGDPAAVGSLLELDQETFEVVGIMPPHLGGHFGGSPDLWLPQNLAPGGNNHHGNQYLSVIARLAPGADPAGARAELTATSQALREEHGRINDKLRISAVPIDDLVLGPSRTLLWILMAAVGAMLAIACINVANLFLARGLGLRRELGIRAALGASGRRLFASALVESLWIGVAGGLLGLGAAWLAVRWLQELRPAALPRFDALGIDLPVFGFCLAAVLVTTLIFGLLPAARASRADVRPASAPRGGVAAGGRRDRRIRDFGVSLQVALSLVLLTAGGLLGRSFLSLHGTDMGFESQGALTFQLRLPSYAYDAPERRVAFYDTLFARLDALPGLTASGATSKLPGDGHRNHWSFGIEGRERADGEPWPGAEIRCVSGRVFEALSIPVVAGRGLGPSDRPGSERVVLVNQALVDRYFQDGGAIGTRVGVGPGDPRTIVGVVSDTRHDPREDAVPKIYVPQTQFADDRNWDLTFVATGPAGTGLGWGGLQGQITAAIADIDARLVVYDVQPLSSVIAEPLARQRFGAQLMVLFAGLSLLLAAVGLFGALAYSLGQRRSEIGVRMALGADRRRVLLTVLGHSLRVFALGAAFGAVGAYGAGRWLENQLHGVQPHDPAALAAAFSALLLAALLATFEPARRASRMDPAKILRES
ncbi:MAG: ABC transporter permease [Acidobacteriota bacterium]